MTTNKLFLTFLIFFFIANRIIAVKLNSKIKTKTSLSLKSTTSGISPSPLTTTPVALQSNTTSNTIKKVIQIIPPNLTPTILGQINGTDIQLYTYINQTTSLIHIYLKYTGKHWFGLGFGSKMKGTDMIIMEVVNKTVIVTDRYSTGYSTPKLDTDRNGTSDIKLKAYYIKSNTITVHLARNLDTKDVNDFKINGPGAQSMIWAWSPSPTIVTHDLGGDFGTVTVTL